MGRSLTPEEGAALLAALAESSTDAIVAQNLEGLVTLWNPAAERVFGYSASDMLGRSVAVLIPAELRAEQQDLVGMVCRGLRLEQFHTRRLRQDGALIEVALTLSPVRGAAGEVTGVTAIGRDVTARHRAEEERRCTEHLFSSFMDKLPGFAWIKDRDGRYTYANRSACVALGAAGEWEGKTDAELCQPELAEAYRRNDRLVIATKAPVEAVETLIVSGARRFALNTKFPLFGADGEVAFVCGIGVDITEQYRAEQQLRQSEAELRALAAQLVSIRERESGRIAREIHDEMGQALTGLKMDVRWLEEQLAANCETLCTEVHARLDAISRALDRTAETTRKVCAELRPGVLDELGLVAALEWQAQEFEARSAIFCNLTLPPCDPPLSPACATTVFRIFQELLTNVARHSGASEVEVNLEVAHGQLRLTVSDNGVGIPESKLAGSGGLGLVGMRERALAAEGTLRIEGGSGGTHVLLVIPVKEAP